MTVICFWAVGLREGLQWSSFFFINCHEFKPVAIDKEKKRERKARPAVFTEGHAHINLSELAK
jgi:hypothetical protein